MSVELHPDWINPEVDLVGVDSHSASIMGTVTDALRRAGNSTEVINAYRLAAMSGDYDNLLYVSMLYGGS